MSITVAPITTSTAARAVDVWKIYGTGETQITALHGVNIELHRGAFTAIIGPSGSGKSTLMHCLAGLDTITRGHIQLGDTPITNLNNTSPTNQRRDKIGFIFQQSNLLPTLTAHENILLPLTITGHKPNPDWYHHIITTTGLHNHLNHRPNQLSAGQQQRVACARALISQPDIIFADEPTGNLDTRTSTEILTLLRHCTTDYGQTIVMVTHNPHAASHADHVIFLTNGHITDQLHTPNTIHNPLKKTDPRELDPKELKPPAEVR